MAGPPPPRGSGPPLVALRDAYLSFADKVIFEGLDIGVAAGERACLVGRNGGGKSTLMRCLAGQLDLDKGSHFKQPGAEIV